MSFTFESKRVLPKWVRMRCPDGETRVCMILRGHEVRHDVFSYIAIPEGDHSLEWDAPIEIEDIDVTTPENLQRLDKWRTENADQLRRIGLPV